MDLSTLIKAVHVRSEYGPDIDLVDPFGPAEPSPFMSSLKPQIILDTDAGPITIAPYGKPGPTRWGVVEAGGLLLLGLAGYGAWRLLRG